MLDGAFDRLATPAYPERSSRVLTDESGSVDGQMTRGPRPGKPPRPVPDRYARDYLASFDPRAYMPRPPPSNTLVHATSSIADPNAWVEWAGRHGGLPSKS